VRRRTALAAAVLLGSACALAAVPLQAAAAATAITVNGTSAGPTFGGIGAISGGGGNTRLLTDYPAAQQQQILDYLFEPGYGADLQILKVEIGGDTNSTDGSESSIEHSSGSINCSAGYEWWLMEQAKALNPNIKLYGLAWGAPGWVGSTFWTTNTINYLISWLNCAASHGLTINYLGGWNERGYNIAWYEQLRSTLNADGYSAVQIVGADSDWSIATDIADNPTFASAVSIIGVHYPCAGGDGGSADTCTGNATATSTGKPLWARPPTSTGPSWPPSTRTCPTTRTAWSWPTSPGRAPTAWARACGRRPRSPSSPSPAGSSSTRARATSAEPRPTAATSH
jgi:O-glycosyl hydrolase